MNDHNHSYKNLFSHPRMVEDLLRGFVHEEWVNQLDFSTLERVSGSYVSDDLREREDDLVWRVQWGKEWLYVYLLIEFQSTIDRFMAVRVLVYLGLLYQDVIDSGQLTQGGRLPPVLPIVLYNGEPRWTAAEDIADLIETVPSSLERYRPRLRYLLLDEGQYREEELQSLQNLVAAVFRLENSRTPDDILKVLTALLNWVKEPEQDSLRRAFTVWLQRVLLPRRVPEARFPELTELHEVRTMLAERVKEWTEEWREQGLQEGIQKGLKQGREKGLQEGQKKDEALMLMRLLERKFGPLSDQHRRILEEADAETLLVWGERVLTANCIEDVLEV
jgi:predicted transposase/invertase (TIGR01784 family)